MCRGHGQALRFRFDLLDLLDMRFPPFCFLLCTLSNA
jgi:hypothetical protein